MSTSDGRPRTVETVEELVGFLELVGLRTFEISGRRVERPAASASEVEVSAPDQPESAVELRATETRNPEEMEVRFRVRVAEGEGEYSFVHALHYKFTEPLVLTQGAVEGLLNRVAVMTVWPFIREALATTAARLELPVPVLGLVRNGDLRLSSDE